MEDIKCYVYVQGNEANEDMYYDLVRRSKDDEIILYPERAMRFIDTVCYRPFVKPVVTENPFIIGCYDRKEVRVIEDGKWVKPEIQTFGCNASLITDDLLHYTNSIPLVVKSGLEGIEEFKNKIKNWLF
jgi:hypothetical protein